ncbi:MAG: WYL domain-containing protein [Spirochaetes bacterium]|nr:WYL domain-containing protein [Spirochaetota bacterium]
MQLEQLLLAHPLGLRRSEIAERLAVHRSTVGRYVDEFSRLLPLTEGDDGKIGIDRDSYLNNIRLTIHESLSLYLACRLMTDRTDRFNPHAAAALRKLGQSLMGFAPRIAEHIVAEAERVESAKTRRDPAYLSVLETLTRGWSAGRLVRLVHHSVHRDVDDVYVFAVQIIVPYAVGQSLQAIGKCPGEDHLRTLRIDRIVEAVLTSETYVPLANEDVTKALESAWGIWYSDADPVEVVLRFSSKVAHRVHETVWHASQELEDLPDGRMLWRAHISEPREMFPWIRGWGADVEVIGPPDLRERMKQETRSLVTLYDSGVNPSNSVGK